MSSGEEPCAMAMPSTDGSSARLRVGDIGEVTGVGPCWRLAYAGCTHIQEIAREGLEDPDRLVRCIERNFSECLTCRMESTSRG